MSRESAAALRQLLYALWVDAAELRYFIHRFSFGPALLRRLPDRASLVEVVDGLLSGLPARRLAQEALFTQLHAHAPAYREEISQVAERYRVRLRTEVEWVSGLLLDLAPSEARLRGLLRGVPEPARVIRALPDRAPLAELAQAAAASLLQSEQVFFFCAHLLSEDAAEERQDRVRAVGAVLCLSPERALERALLAFTSQPACDLIPYLLSAHDIRAAELVRVRLASGLPLGQQAHQAVQLLTQNRLLGEAFFSRLVEEFPPSAAYWRALMPWFVGHGERPRAVTEPLPAPVPSVPVRDEARRRHGEHERLARRFFEAASRSVEVSGGALRAPHLVFVASGPSADVADVARLRAMLQADGERCYFLHKGRLSEAVEEALGALRLDDHPVVALSWETMQSALTDQRCALVLREQESLFFDPQNLFAQTNALSDARLFFGRGGLLVRVGSTLAKGDALLLTGLRKSGKTSLLNVLRQHMVGHPWCHIDLQRFDPHREDWPTVVFTELIAAFDRWGARLEDWPVRPGEVVPISTGTGLLQALRQRRRWQAERGYLDHRPVLVLDEGERVFPRQGEPTVAKRLVRAAGALRAVIQGEGLLSMVVADLRPVLSRVNLLASEDTNPFFLFFEEIPLPLLTAEETAEMVSTIGAAMGLEAVEAAFVEELQAFSGGHPALSRMLAAAAYEERSRSGALVAADLKAAQRVLHRRGRLDGFFEQNIWCPATAAEQAVLSWLSLQEGARAPAEAPEGLRAPQPWVTLAEQGVLRELEGERYAFAMEGLCRWVRARQPSQERLGA